MYNRLKLEYVERRFEHYTETVLRLTGYVG